MAKGRLSAQLRDRDGNVARNAEINVYTAGTTTPATLYRGSNGTTAIANPVTADAEGGIDVYLNAGAYDLVGAGSVDQRGVVVSPDVTELANAATAAGGADVTTTGDVIMSAAGKGLRIKEGGAAAKMGTLTLNGTTEVTVATTAVTANSRIFLSVQEPGGTPAGACYVSSRVAGTSFGVKGVALDTSIVAWLIVEPSA